MISNKLKERFACILVYPSNIPPGEGIPWAQKWVEEHPGEVDWWDEIEKFAMNHPSCNLRRMYHHLALFFIAQRNPAIAYRCVVAVEEIEGKHGPGDPTTILEDLSVKISRNEPIDPKWYEKALSVAFSLKTDDVEYKELLETYLTLYDYAKEKTGKDDKKSRKHILTGLDSSIAPP